jgi:hypothetical protein
MKHKEKYEITHVSQYCLEATPLVNFAKKLSKDIKMCDIRFRANHNDGRHANAIPEHLKKMGLQSAITLGDPIEVRGVFKGVVTPAMVENITKSVAKLYKIPVEKFYIIDITLTDKQNTSVVTFHRMYKSIKLPNDKRRKKLVLGMKSNSGLDPHGLLAELNSKKVTCTFGKVEKTIVMCSEESVVK